MEKAPEGLEGETDSLYRRISCCEERLEQSVNDLQSQITTLKAAVERALSNLLPKVESLITEGRVVSKASSDEAPPGAREAAAPSTSTSKAPFVSNPRRTSVTEAAAAGDAVALRLILANGGDANTRDSNGVPALHLAAARGHVQAVGALLDGRACVDLDGPGVRSALHVATAQGHVDVIRRLLKAGSDMEIIDGGGNTPLMLAVKGRQWQIVRLLVEQGAVNRTVFEDKTALTVAVAEGELETIAVILSSTGPCRSHTLSYAKNVSVVWAFEKVWPGYLRKNGSREMIEAARCGRLESMVALLDAGVGIDSKLIDHKTALMSASEYGRVECVNELVRRGALLDEYDFKGKTALHYAIIKEDEEVVRVLLKAGADTSKKDKYRYNWALHLAGTESMKNLIKKYTTYSS